MTGLAFSFGGFAESSAGVNVDSNLGSALQAKLVGPPTGDYPISVTLNKPTSCSMGGTTISDSDVALVTDLGGSSTEHTGTTLSATTADLRNFGLRFRSAGNYGRLSGAVSCTSGSLVASVGGQTATLNLGSVGGSVLACPMWQNSASTELQSLVFTFSGYTETSTNVNVDSSTNQLKLVNATSYPASIAVTLPGACSIGGTSISDSQIALRTNAQGSAEDLGNGTMSISSDSLRDYTLRFKAAGGYGRLNGTVACTAGSLAFSF